MVAETATEAQESSQLTETAAVETEDTATQAVVEVTDTTPADGTDTPAVSTSFSVEDLPEYKEALGNARVPEASRQLPGKSVEQVAEEERQQRSTYYAQRLVPSAERDVINKLRDSLGEDDARATWQQIVKPYLDAQHANYEYFSTAAQNEAVKLGLSEDEGKAYFGRAYADRKEAVQGLVAVGRQMADAEWQAKVEKEYVPVAAVKKIGDAAFNAGRKQLADVANSAESGEGITDDSTAGVRITNLYENDVAFNEGRITPAVYAANEARLKKS